MKIMGKQVSKFSLWPKYHHCKLFQKFFPFKNIEQLTWQLIINLFYFLEIDSVPVGGSREVRLAKADYTFAKAAVKPSQLVLRLVDKLFSKEVLMRSTVHGTKEFAPLDQNIIAAIKGNLRFTAYRSFRYKIV